MSVCPTCYPNPLLHAVASLPRWFRWVFGTCIPMAWKARSNPRRRRDWISAIGTSWRVQVLIAWAAINDPASPEHGTINIRQMKAHWPGVDPDKIHMLKAQARR